MTTWGDRLGRGARLDIGVGVSTPPLPVQDPEDIIYSSFQRGIVKSDSQEEIPPNSAQDACDVRIDRDDSLIRLEGVQAIQGTFPHPLTYMFQHASLDFSTELVVFDPPHLGRKTGGGNFVWDNVGLDATSIKGWNVVNVAGVLLFSNGTTGTYTRQPGASTVTDISADAIADTFATAFGRVFAGAFTDPVSGYQGLGIRWNGTGSPPEEDWNSANASAELLLSNQQEADRIIAIRPIGFDALAVLTRKAIWMGYQTGQANHPAQFKIRFPGRGCVAEPTAVASPNGVIYLSDEGVVLANLNNANIISTQINKALLPLNYAELLKYKAAYQPILDRYVLITPSGVWYYEFPRADPLGGADIPGRWYFSSHLPNSIVVYTDQSGNVYWSTIAGTWAEQTLTWAEMAIGELEAPPIVHFGKLYDLGFESAGATTYIDAQQTPFWVTPQARKRITNQISTLWFEIEYATTSQAQIDILTRDTNGNFTNIRSVILPNTNGQTANGVFGFQGTGKGSAVMIKWERVSRANISRLRQVFIDSGPVQTSLQVL